MIKTISASYLLTFFLALTRKRCSLKVAKFPFLQYISHYFTFVIFPLFQWVYAKIRSLRKKNKLNLIELDIKTRVDGAIRIKLFKKFFHPQIKAGALGFALIYKAGAERVKC